MKNESLVPVDIQLDPLPHFWDRSVIFFANIHALFYGNKAETQILDSQVRGVDAYGARMLPILPLLYKGDDNLLVLEASPDQALLRYHSHELGLATTPCEVISRHHYDALPASLEKNQHNALPQLLKNHPAAWVDGFVTDETLSQIAEKLDKTTMSSFAGSHQGNNKYLLHYHLKEKNLLVFDTYAASSVAEVISSLAKLGREGYAKGVVKAQIGASGCGMLITATSGITPHMVPDYLFHEGPCLVQGWIDANHGGISSVASPSVQLFVAEQKTIIYDITEQLLSKESIHEGNISPPPCLQPFPQLHQELLEQAAVAARWLHAQGYRGTASCDFLTFVAEGSPKAMLCEINARVTGATYPAILGSHFNPHGAWLMRNLSFSTPVAAATLLDLMGKKEVLFLPDRGQGILPFNFTITKDGKVGKGQFVCLAPDPQDCKEILEKAVNILPVEWAYDRD